MNNKKTYMIQSKFQPYNLVYGAWLNDNDNYWCWHDKDGSTIYTNKEHYKVISEW
jgi:hypothetical protein